MDDEDTLVDALARAIEAEFEAWDRSLEAYYYRTGRKARRGASLKTLRKRLAYGGRKGRRAARRLGLRRVRLGREL